MDFPALIKIGDYYSFEDYIETLYECFLQTLIYDIPVHERDYISVEIPNQNILEDKKIKCFWHLITKEEHSTGDRLPDPSRSEKIPWIKFLIENFITLGIKHFEKIVKGKIRHHIWYESERYCIVIDIHNISRYYLITAYYVTQKKRNQLKKEHQKYVRTGKPIQ